MAITASAGAVRQSIWCDSSGGHIWGSYAWGQMGNVDACGRRVGEAWAWCNTTMCMCCGALCPATFNQSCNLLCSIFKPKRDGHARNMTVPPPTCRANLGVVAA